MSAPATTADDALFGQHLRYWRGVRRKSQLELAVEARTTPRHLSFVETGRSRPSRHMVMRLAHALDVPLREQNDLLLAAGYAPIHRTTHLHEPEFDAVWVALTAMMQQHEPYPAVLMDRGWNLLRANDGARFLFGRIFHPEPVPELVNILKVMIGPSPVRAALQNWSSVVRALMDRARREAIGGVPDRELQAVVDELRLLPDVADAIDEPAAAVSGAPVVDVQFVVDDTTINFFSVVSTIGSPIDVTAQELRLEAFFPGDEASRHAWAALRGR
jgi:transcriptional regulator with XRE-family HTH domain